MIGLRRPPEPFRIPEVASCPAFAGSGGGVLIFCCANLLIVWCGRSGLAGSGGLL
jgi:hypothetical protein